MKPYIVAVGGGSGSGKTTVVRLLKSLLQSSASLIEIDNYYLDRSHMPLLDRSSVNYDHPDSIDKDLLLLHLAELRAGKAVPYPQYDFKSHTRQASIELKPAKVLILDGIFALCDPRIFDVVDLKIFVECDSDIRIVRRAQRDAQLRGRDLASVLEQYTQTVKPMHAKFIEPTKYRADLIIPWHENKPDIIKLIARLIENS